MSASQMILLLLIGYIVFTIDKKQENFPVPVILVLCGVSLHFMPYFSSIEVTESMVYHVFLPALLFTAAYQFPAEGFRKNAGIITFLATVGIILTVALLGALIYVLSGPFVSISFLGALLIASILTPTDPVSVTSIIKSASGDMKVVEVVEGESLINDGTSIVIFSTLAGMFTGSESVSILSFFWEFLLVSLGGTLLGLALGWLMGKAVHLTHHKQYQVMLSIILAYGTFNLAEAIGVSGVLATVFAGIMLSFEYGRATREDHFREALDGFWGIAELSILSLLFLLIGVQAAKFLVFDGWGFAFIIFALALLVRFIIITTTTQLFPHWRRHISWRESVLISWSGLKGSMSVYLILSLYAQSSPGDAELIISLSFAAVLLSLGIQSLGVSPLSRKLMK
ncbi:cation:proton antiporter [Lacicoccus alkaliphilus]|uniref:Sodium/proton antiporter, CPA1 family (TC 2.A.36) n=1 Tax=Lacicoccus alkaliphilus DSM 16010 TaxID=1123231 RepID=A0A1M7ARE4_9BACL|nr:cation:proton antiporter [Salinicoccus alkaliphilus]SHL45278.1 sodium/proton antiporter, CPA1 family (TC 2.A.36) [Salinicoccus alkaliphilus DSM 16010]